MKGRIHLDPFEQFLLGCGSVSIENLLYFISIIDN